MILIDANLLLSAYHPRSEHHERSRTLADQRTRLLGPLRVAAANRSECSCRRRVQPDLFRLFVVNAPPV